jgi:hypothetical protein
LEHHVSGVMAEGIVKAFEMVEVKEKNGSGLFFTAGQLQFSFQRFLEESAVEQASERIANRLFTKSFAELKTGQREGNLRGHADGELRVRFPKSPRALSKPDYILEFEVQHTNRVPLCDHRYTKRLDA